MVRIYQVVASSAWAFLLFTTIAAPAKKENIYITNSVCIDLENGLGTG